MANTRLGIGFIGSGFITRFHIEAWEAVRDADVRGVWSPTREHAESAAAYARELRVGEARAFDSIEAMVADPSIDALWICGPNHKRVENVEEIVHALQTGPGELKGLACEKPLARNVREARQVVALVEETDLLHGYLEDQLFSPGLARGKEIAWQRGAALTGRPYLARAAEEHSGPHAPWFWHGDLQGGGVLNDMMCHSVEVARFLLTAPGAPRESLRIKEVNAQIASLKWSRDKYARMLEERGVDVDYREQPSEDYAHATIEYEDEDGHPLISEVTTSWAFVGPGLRLRSELLGPEYSLESNTLDASTTLFLSRAVQGEQDEDLLEKQNAEQGLMPIVSNEASAYGYEGENRHFVRCFLDGEQPELDFHAGLEVVELLMTAYMSAEQKRALPWKPDGLAEYVPPVARGAGV